jgi:hypothetical protein
MTEKQLDLSVLMNLKITRPEDVKAAIKGSRALKCTDGDFMLTKSGKIIFSGEFRAKVEKGIVDEATPNYIDVIDGRLLNPSIPAMFIALTPGTTKESPRATIKQEGKVASIDKFVKNLANAIYGCNWASEESVSFNILWDNEVKTEEPYFYFPCEVTETIVKEDGTKEIVTKPDYNRRDSSKVKMYPVIPVNITTTKQEVTVTTSGTSEEQLEIPFDEA